MGLVACQGGAPEEGERPSSTGTIVQLDMPEKTRAEAEADAAVEQAEYEERVHDDCIFNNVAHEDEILIYDLGISSERWHVWRHGFSIDTGRPMALKYMQGGWKSGWGKPDCFAADDTTADEWKRGRCQVWNEGTTAPLRFVLPAEASQPGKKWQLVVRLFPKINNRVDVRLNSLGLIQSVPLKGGWETIRVSIPNESFKWGGENTLNFAFLGSYFQDSVRVAAKFDYISLIPEETFAMLRNTVPVPMARLDKARILRNERQAWGLVAGDEMSAYLFVPEKGHFRAELGPGEWLQTGLRFELKIITDDGSVTSLRDGYLKAGDCWRSLDLDLSAWAGKAVRVSFHVWQENAATQIANVSRETAYLANPRLVQLKSDRNLDEIKNIIRENTKSVVFIAVDGLRADRLLSPKMTRATSFLRSIAAEAMVGGTLATGAGAITNTVSLLYGLNADKHGIMATQTHVKQSFYGLGEFFSEIGYYTGYYSNNAFTSPKLGFAQGFSEQRFAADEELGAKTEKLLQLVTQKIKSHPEKGFYFVQLSELRMPWGGSEENRRAFSLAGYEGQITPESLQNPFILRNFTHADRQQLAAYYDAELFEVDAQLKDFVQNLEDGTLVVLTGTHGTALGDDSLIGYGNSLSPAELLVPTMFYLKGSNISHQIPNVTSSVDIYATLVDLFEKEPEAVENAAPEGSPKGQEAVETAAATPAYAKMSGHSLFAKTAATLPQAFSETHRAILNGNMFYLLRTGDNDTLNAWTWDSMTTQNDARATHAISHRAMRDLIE